MNTMVSIASLSTAAAVAMPPITAAGPTADGVSFPDLAARFLALRDGFKSTTSDSEWEEIGDRLMPVVTAIVNQPPKSLCDLGWQTEAFLTWADDFEVIEEHDDAADRMIKTFLANVRSLAGPLPSIPIIVRTPETADPIFAVIEAHRKAAAEFEECVSLHSRLEQELPDELCQTDIRAYEETVVETEDPRWIAAERAVLERPDAADEVAYQLLRWARRPFPAQQHYSDIS